MTYSPSHCLAQASSSPPITVPATLSSISRAGWAGFSMPCGLGVRFSFMRWVLSLVHEWWIRSATPPKVLRVLGITLLSRPGPRCVSFPDFGLSPGRGLCVPASPCLSSWRFSLAPPCIGRRRKAAQNGQRDVGEVMGCIAPASRFHVLLRDFSCQPMGLTRRSS